MLKDLFNNKGRSKNFKSDLKKILGYTPSRLDLYELAFTHSSVVKNNSIKGSNERLEFLGDAILDSIVSEYLFKKYPFKDEGFLTEIRSRIVKRATLNELAIKIGMKDMLEYSGRAFQKNIFGNAFEALIGAIYLDKGYKRTVKFIHNKIFDTHLDIEHLVENNDNYKSILLEWSSKNGFDIEFETSKVGVKGGIGFESLVFKNKSKVGSGKGKTKKMSEQDAAKSACEKLNLL